MCRNTQRRVTWTSGDHCVVFTIPWVGTSGYGATAWNNSAHAAVHELLAALQCDKKEDVLHWMARAQKNLTEAYHRLAKPTAKVPPAGPKFKRRAA